MTELNLSGCEHVGGETCNPTRRMLQPHAPHAATPRARGCNPTRQRLQPHAPEAATPRARGCNAPEAASPCAQVGDEGVSCLAQLCRLKRLDLGGAPLVSQRALHALQAALPS